MNRFLVKIEDHMSHFDIAPFVNYQGDRYMEKSGLMYLVIEDPTMVDVLENVIPIEAHYGDKVPPKPAIWITSS